MNLTKLKRSLTSLRVRLLKNYKKYLLAAALCLLMTLTFKFNLFSNTGIAHFDKFEDWVDKIPVSKIIADKENIKGVAFTSYGSGWILRHEDNNEIWTYDDTGRWIMLTAGENEAWIYDPYEKRWVIIDIKENEVAFFDISIGKYVLVDTHGEDAVFYGYKSQVGLQGYIFSFLHNKIGMGIDTLCFMCCLLLSVSLIVICYALMKKYNAALGIVFYVVSLFSPWFTLLARNLDWLPFTWFLPAMFSFLLSLDYKNKKRRIIFFPLIFLSFFIKCLCDYNYITVVALLPLLPFFTDFIFTKEKTEKLESLLSGLYAGLSLAAGFIIAILIHAGMRGEGNVGNGLIQIIREDVLRRTFGNPDDFSPEFQAALTASVFDVLKLYMINWKIGYVGLRWPAGYRPDFDPGVLPFLPGMTGALFMPLTGFAVAAVILNIIKKRKDAYKEAAMLGFLFITCVSWFVMAKAHSYSHTPNNFVLWYFGYVQIVVYIIFRFLKQVISDLKPAMLLPENDNAPVSPAGDAELEVLKTIGNPIS